MSATTTRERPRYGGLMTYQELERDFDRYRAEGQPNAGNGRHRGHRGDTGQMQAVAEGRAA